MEDHSVHAVRELGQPAKGDAQLQRTIDFFSRASRFAREKNPELVISCFVYAFMSDKVLNACAAIDELDYFGIDGKCFPKVEPSGKTLFGNIERAIAACRKHHTGTLALIETQKLTASQLQATVEHLPDFLEHDIGHLLYYYHGACRDDDEWCMNRMRPLLSNWRQRRNPTEQR
jgi:hypothetical protein